jgi:hypothetical protein
MCLMKNALRRRRPVASCALPGPTTAMSPPAPRPSTPPTGAGGPPLRHSFWVACDAGCGREASHVAHAWYPEGQRRLLPGVWCAEHAEREADREQQRIAANIAADVCQP